MRKIIPVLIAAAMLVIVFSAVGTDAAATDGGLYINGRTINESREMTVDEGTEHWTYVYSSNTLTINADSIFSKVYTEEELPGKITSYGIMDETFRGFNLVLNADLKITGYNDTSGAMNLAIYTAGTLTISGSGKLTIDHGDPDHHYDQGLTSNGDININGATLEICTKDDLYAGVGGGGSFNMNAGELNLVGSGTACGDNVNIRNGTINVDGKMGTIRNSIYAKGDDANFQMTGGAVNFANVSPKGDSIMHATGFNSSTLDLHGAKGTNWEIKEDTYVMAIEDGSASIVIYNSYHPAELELDEEPMYIVVGAVAFVALAMLCAMVFHRKN